ncbi:MAG: type VI secretion system protein TssA [Pseudomonadales bacterium]|nr:type VI secretion system protein TssA [Pseudomonadales bacterium]
MASPEIVDIEGLTQPISDESPTGEDIRADRSATSVFYQIKDARERARTAERNMFHEEDTGSSANDAWREILEIAPTILKESSKDLEVAAWYVEALSRIYGFAGLRDGFKLTTVLVESFWDDIFPIPDEDDEEDIREFRTAPFAGLNGEGRDGTLIAPLKRIEITEETDCGPFAYWQYQQALEIQKIHDEDVRDERIASAGVSTDLFDRAVNDTSVSFFRDLIDDMEAALEEFAALNAVFDEKADSYSPPSSNIKNTISEILGTVNHLTKDKMAMAAPAEELDEEGAVSEDGTPAAGGGAAVGSTNIANAVIANREEAFRQLLKIADFFKKTEPHSPVSYAIEKTVKWGRMSLHELMNELLLDSQAKENYEMLTGVKLEPEDEY